MRLTTSFKKTASAFMSRDASAKSFVSVNSISTSEGFRLPSYLGEHGKAQLQKLFEVLREELAQCDTSKKVEKVSKTADRVSSGSDDNFNMSGRVAYRFREATRAIGGLDSHHKLAFRKVLKCEVQRRLAEIAGWDEKDAEEMALVSDMLEKELQRRLAKLPPPRPRRHSLSEEKDSEASKDKFEARMAQTAFQDSGNWLTPIAAGSGRSSRLPSKSNLAEKPGTPASGEVEKNMNSPLKETLQTAHLSGHFQPFIESFRTSSKDLRDKEIQASQAVDTESEKWTKVYHAIKEDSGIHRIEIEKAMGLLGFLKPDKKWIDDVFQSITKFIHLREDEWIKFVEGYIARQKSEYRDAFDRCDDDSSGVVDGTELVGLLKSFGIEPLDHVLKEILSEVDGDGTGSLDIDEFEMMMELARVREGFTKNEYEDLVSLFSKFDGHKTGEIDCTDMLSVVSWLGLAVHADKVESIVKSVDFDESGKLNQSEFISCMRKMMEEELDSMREVITANDDDGNGLIGIEELRGLFSSLGYNTRLGAVLEAGVDAGVLPELPPDLLNSHASTGSIKLPDAQLDLGQLWQLLVVWRNREGFSSAECKDLTEAFSKYDKAHAGEINVIETGKMLRWLGYTPAFELQQHLVRRVDVDNSGMLNLSEFQKLVRMLQSKEMETINEAFNEHDKSQRGLIPIDRADRALRGAGCVNADDRTPQIPEQELMLGEDVEGFEKDLSIDPKGTYVTLDSFLRTATRFHKQARRTFRENSGFSQSEIIEMTKTFSSYDQNGSGDISSDELIRLIEDLFPDMAHNPSMRQKLANLMAEVDQDGSGSLDFPDFLRLMQQLQELKMQERIAKEQRASQECSFDAKEVEQFRELFLGIDEGTGYLTFAMLQQMLGTICPLGDKNLTELTGLVRSVVARPGSAAIVGQPSVDFPEFLKVMRRLLDTNFAGIKARLAPQEADS